MPNWPCNGPNRGEIGLQMDVNGSPALLLTTTGKALQGPTGWYMSFNVQQLDIF